MTEGTAWVTIIVVFLLCCVGFGVTKQVLDYKITMAACEAKK